MEMLFSYHHVAKRYIPAVCAGVVFLVSLIAPFLRVQGEEGMSLTIAPPLFQINLQPGETWSSSIAVVNNNTYNISLYADPVLFKPSGESGSPVFISPTNEDGLSHGPDTSTLAGWITVPQGAFEVTREQTYNLPLTISVPKDAAPGGHYAAVLIGNHAPEGTSEESVVNVTSSIAALIFLSVSGDVIEKGRIRDFVTEKSLYETAQANFSLRFENQGNVHLLPQGNIVIYNMFGKVRGTIPVNHNRDYGNVLPESVRRFSFTWESDAGFWDIGRYKAEATIGYGKDMKQSALATTYFYILPIVPLLEIISGLFAFIFFIGWALRVYIRRALAIESLRLGMTQSVAQGVAVGSVSASEAPKLKLVTLVKPIQAGFVDLRRVGTVAQTSRNVVAVGKNTARPIPTEEVLNFGTFLRKYKFFFMFVVIMAIGTFALNVYFEDVMTVSRDFTVAEIRPDNSVVELSEDI
jgi:hypothetical protein